MSTRQKHSLVIVSLIFLSGILIGLSGALWIANYRIEKLLSHETLSSEDRLLLTLSEKLKLTPAQQRIAREAYRATEVERQLSRIRIRPDSNQPAYRFIRELQKGLTAEQQKKLNGVLLDSINVNRPPCILSLLEKLELSMDEREPFDRVLASHANLVAVGRESVDATCVELLSASEDDMAKLLSPERFDRFRRYTADLKKKGAR